MKNSIVANMINSENQACGTATFTEVDNGLILQLEFHNLPEGEFAMHIHEVGSATAPDFKDAGGHFNPTNKTHGIHSENGAHIGDLPNIKVPASGEFTGTYVVQNASLTKGVENTLNQEDGTSLIVHSGADDYKSQPTGDAGSRQLAGIIFEKQDK